MGYESIREIRDTFSSLMDGNRSVQSLLEKTRSQTRDKSNAAKKDYNTLLEQFVLLALLQHDSKPEILQKMSAGFSENMNLGDMYRAQIRHNNENISEYSRLTDIHGPLDKLQASMTRLNGEIGKIKNEKTAVLEQIDHDREILKPVDVFNAQAQKAGRPAIDSQQGVDYYHSKTGLNFVAALVFDGHYRRGRELIESFREEHGLSILEVQARLKRSLEQPQMMDNKMDALRKAEPAAQAPIGKMSDLKKEIQTEDQVLQQAKEGIVHYLDDPRFFNKVAAALGDEFPTEAVQLRAKIESYAKVEEGLTQNIDILKKATENLDKPMYKLNKGVRNGKGSKRVDIDLDGIRKSYKDLQAASKKRAEGVQDINLSIENFKFTPEQMDKISAAAASASVPDMTAMSVSSGAASRATSSGPDFLTMYMLLMVHDMSFNHMHSSIDNGLLHSTFNGIPGDLSRDLGLPSFDAGSVMDSFNHSSGLDSLHIDTGNFNVDTSAFNFDTPSFDVGSSSFDFGGGGGGFDAGGGGFD